MAAPAPLLWALLAAVWGTRARAASKGVWNMRLCKVVGHWWDTHLRVGGLPEEGLRQVVAPDFGEPLCYIAVVAGKPTRMQCAWYTTAQVHNKVQKQVRGWGHSAYTVMCLAIGENASAWAQN